MTDTPARITNLSQLKFLASELGVRHDWHEPDDQNVSAEVRGGWLDNAGYWGSLSALLPVTDDQKELWVVIKHNGEPVAEVNLATLLAFACGTYEG